MRKALLMASFVVSMSFTTLAQDPVKVDPKHYKVEFENAQVRVLRVTVAPGEKSIMHRHPNAVAIFLTDLNSKFTFPDKTTLERTEKAGSAIWTPAVTHLPENTGTQPFEVILVELKTKRSRR